MEINTRGRVLLKAWFVLRHNGEHIDFYELFAIEPRTNHAFDYPENLNKVIINL